MKWLRLYMHMVSRKFVVSEINQRANHCINLRDGGRFSYRFFIRDGGCFRYLASVGVGVSAPTNASAFGTAAVSATVPSSETAAASATLPLSDSVSVLPGFESYRFIVGGGGCFSYRAPVGVGASSS